MRRTLSAMLALLGACSGGLIGDGSDLPSKTQDGKNSAGATPALVDAEPDLRQLVTPSHGDLSPWRYPDKRDTLGAGPCAGTSLAAIIDEVRARVPDVNDISEFRSLGPQGVPISNAGPAIPAGQAPPPASGTVGYVLGLMDDQSFGLVFVRGRACRGDQCETQERWYYETDHHCRPRWVGHLKMAERAGGKHGRCLDVEGAALWSQPGSPGARERCDADWSAQNISGTRSAMSISPGATCGKKEAFVPVTIVINQAADLSRGTLVVNGTGIDFLDGKALFGAIERQAFSGTIEEQVPGPCPLQRTFKFSLDFEPGNAYGLPGGFGILDVNETPVAACTPAPSTCSASLHFIRP